MNGRGGPSAAFSKSEMTEAGFFSWIELVWAPETKHRLLLVGGARQSYKVGQSMEPIFRLKFIDEAEHE